MVGWNSIKWSLQLSGRTMSLQQHYAMSIGRAFQTSCSWWPICEREVAWDQILTWIMQEKSIFTLKKCGVQRACLKPQSMWGSWGSLLHIALTTPSVVNGHSSEEKISDCCTKFHYLQIDWAIPCNQASAFLVICDQLKLPHVFLYYDDVMTWFQKTVCQCFSQSDLVSL